MNGIWLCRPRIVLGSEETVTRREFTISAGREELISWKVHCFFDLCDLQKHNLHLTCFSSVACNCVSMVETSGSTSRLFNLGQFASSFTHFVQLFFLMFPRLGLQDVPSTVHISQYLDKINDINHRH